MNATSYELIQAVRGPLMLIALGGLVELDYAGVYGFGRTWPVLFIVFGLLKLLEQVARPAAYDGAAGPPQPRQGSAI